MLTTTVLVILGSFAATLRSDSRPVLGLDLQGGVSIVLFPVEGTDLSALNTAADVIRNRVDGLGIAEPDVNRQGDTIVVDLPGVKDTEKAKRLVGQTAELRFRSYLGSLAPDQPVPEPTTTTTGKEGASTTTSAASTTTTTAPSPSTTKGDAAGVHAPEMTPIAAVRPAQQATTSAAASTTTATAGATGSTTTTTADPLEPKPGSTCDDLVTPREDVDAEGTFWLPNRDGGCTLVGPAALTGKAVRSAKAEYGPQGWSVVVKFKDADAFDKVAAENYQRNLPIELDGVVVSAPVIEEQEYGGTAIINGSTEDPFSKSEAQDLALVLRYGSLPVQFDQEKETSLSISPSLGKDQLRAGIVAGLIGLALVALYMILYYRLLGLVVWIGLGLTAMVFFTIVSYLSASRGLTLTLAGVTGLIVSVGVTVDSYVVYFERLKDEVRTGKTVRSSLESGFRRAFRTIVAADLVSLLGAVVLYLLATSSVRGFAFFLGLSTAIDLVLAYFFMYPLVSLMALRPSLVQMKGVGIAAGLDVVGAKV
jgi:preprotein translocase subunit SecD